MLVTKTIKNNFGQKIGHPVENWLPPESVKTAPKAQTLQGHYCRLTTLDATQAPLLAQSFQNTQDAHWTYLAYGPFRSTADYENWVNFLQNTNQEDSLTYCIQSANGQEALGISAFLRINPNAGSIEIGNVCFSPKLQKTPLATEAIFLLIDTVFQLGYRRCEWKCNSLNEASRKAAARFGFEYEGTFRQAQVVKGHNRDTAWFSILDEDWPATRLAFISWLLPDNFDSKGKQKKRLADLIKANNTGQKK